MTPVRKETQQNSNKVTSEALKSDLDPHLKLLQDFLYLLLMLLLLVIVTGVVVTPYSS